MQRIETIVQARLASNESDEAKRVYVGSKEQADTYEQPPDYALVISDLIASTQPNSVLEFGCNAGRNLDLLSKKLPTAILTGVDVNSDAIQRATSLHDIPLIVGDDTWLETQKDDSYDVVFTISVVDHIPYPETVLRHLLRAAKHYLILFEMTHDRLGKATHNLYLNCDDQPLLKPAYRYSYTHDYRYECERKFGAHCLVDVKFPIDKDNLLDLYRLYVFSKRSEWRDRTAISSITLKGLGLS